MEKWLCPSMMCADFGNIEKEIRRLEQCGVDFLHLDVMDGNYVQNFGMGMQEIEFICKKAKIPTEVHLMINKPHNHIKKFIDLGISQIYIHHETEFHPAKTLQDIEESGCKAGIVLSPETSIESVMALFDIVDNVMIMLVHPGFSGQKYLEYVEKKILNILELKQKNNYKFNVVLDGACTIDTIKKFNPLGVKGFVIGTAAMFGHKESYEMIIPRLRKA